MVSDFRKKKYTHLFNSFLDADKNGFAEKQDLDGFVDKIRTVRGFQPGDAKLKEFQGTLQKIWDSLLKQVDKDNDGKVSVEEWVLVWDEYAKNQAGAQDWQNLYEKFIFDLLDVGNDGNITDDEHASVLAGFGLNKDETKANFAKLNKGKSTLNWAEFRQAWKQYFTSEDASDPGNYLLGKF